MIYNFVLFILTCLIWGSTWLGIHWELGSVSPWWSVTYRFWLAAIILLSYCFLASKKMRFSLKDHRNMFLQGILLFGINYALYYIGMKYLISGLEAVFYAIIIITNIIFSHLFFKTRLEYRVVLGALIGLTGLAIIFGGQFLTLWQKHENTHQLVLGALICIIATVLASLGNIMSVYNQKQKIPILQSNAYGMLYGAIILLLASLCLRIPITFEISTLYIGDLAYLTIFGSIIAFGIYLRLLSRIGPSRAAYVFIIIPVIALVLSTIYESFHWTFLTLIGLIFILCGNVLVIMPRGKKLLVAIE